LKRQLLNQLINLFWTILAFGPVLAFWLAVGPNIYLFLSMTLSVCTLYFPEKFYESIQISERIEFYENLQLKVFRRFTQDGDLVKQIIGNKNQPASIVRSKTDLTNYLSTIKVYERFHFICFAFFLLTTLYAIVLTNFAIALMITLANVIYNVIPLLLQQYNKLRIKKLLKG